MKAKVWWIASLSVLAVIGYSVSGSETKQDAADDSVKIELIGTTSTVPSKTNIDSWTLDLWSPGGKRLKGFTIEDGIYNSSITAKSDSDARYLVFSITSPNSFEPLDVLEYVPDGVKVFGMTGTKPNFFCYSVVGNFQIGKPKYYIAQMIPTKDKEQTYRLGYARGSWTKTQPYTEFSRTGESVPVAKGDWGELVLTPRKAATGPQETTAYFVVNGAHPEKEQLFISVQTTDGRKFTGYAEGRYELSANARMVAPKLSEVTSVTVCTRPYKFVEFKGIRIK